MQPHLLVTPEDITKRLPESVKPLSPGDLELSLIHISEPTRPY